MQQQSNTIDPTVLNGLIRSQRDKVDALVQRGQLSDAARERGILSTLYEIANLNPDGTPRSPFADLLSKPFPVSTLVQASPQSPFGSPELRRLFDPIGYARDIEQEKARGNLQDKVRALWRDYEITGPRGSQSLRRRSSLPRLSVEDFLAMWPNAPPSLAQSIVDQQDDLFPRYGINTPDRLLHFLAQVTEESGGGTELSEKLGYSTKQMMKVWPKRFPTVESTLPYVYKPESLANKVYGGRRELGNVNPGDGWTYRGRGLIQITGRQNYADTGRRLGLDLLKSPHLASDPKYALAVALDDFTRKPNILADADHGDIRRVTLKLNGGLTNFPERVQAYRDWARRLKLKGNLRLPGKTH